MRVFSTLQRIRITDWLPITARRSALIGGSLLAAVSLSGVVGPAGILIVLGGLLVAWRSHTAVGVVILHSGALLTNGPPALWLLGLLEAASILWLSADFRTLRQWYALVGLSGLVALGGGGSLLLTQTYSVATVTVVVAVTTGVTIYLGHRYEQFTLGLLPANQ